MQFEKVLGCEGGDVLRAFGNTRLKLKKDTGGRERYRNQLSVWKVKKSSDMVRKLIMMRPRIEP